MLCAAAPEVDIHMQLLVRGQYPDFGFLNQLPEMTTSNSVGQLVRSGFGYTAAAGAAQSNIAQQMLQMRPGEMSSCNPTDTLVQAMLASRSSGRSSGRLEDAVVGCGQKRGPSSISCYPACFETASASVEELAATTAAETYDDVGEDSISCAQYYKNNVESKKRRLTLDQVRSLERNFEEENKLESDRKLQLAKELGLQPRQVAVWFQNRRARWKTKQLERDYQVLTSDYNRLKTQLQAAIEEKQELQAKVQGLSAGKGKPVDQEESLGCETAAAEGAAGDEVRKVIRVLESTAATEPSTLQQQLHPACSNDHAAADIQLMIKPESKLVVELSNNISCCRSADDVQIKNLHESARSSFLPDQDQVPSNCWTSRSKQLEYGSPISSTVASPSSEILDADSPRTIDSCTTLSQLTQVMDHKLLGTSFSSSFSSSSSGYSHELMEGSAALDHTIVNPAASCMIDFSSIIITEEDMCCSNVNPPLVLDHSPLRTVQDSSSYPSTTAIKLEPDAADDHEAAVIMGAAAAAATSTIFQDSTDSCINYSLFHNQLAHVDAVVEHAAGLAGGSATALPWWDNWP